MDRPAVLADIKRLMKAADMGRDISIIEKEGEWVEHEGEEDGERVLGLRERLEVGSEVNPFEYYGHEKVFHCMRVCS